MGKNGDMAEDAKHPTDRDEAGERPAQEPTQGQGKETGMTSTQGEDPMLRAHRQSYTGFIRLLTASTIGVAVVLILMAAFLL